MVQFTESDLRFIVLDVDECSASVSVCDANADCKNTFGSYRCSCKAGFTGDGKTCNGKRVAEWLSVQDITFILDKMFLGQGGIQDFFLERGETT